MTRRRESMRLEAGFTLVEVLVALMVLLTGMVGVFALFAAALELQKEATERLDVAMNLSAVMSQVQSDLSERMEGKDAKGAESLNGETFPVPGNEGYRYRVTLEPIPDDPSGRGFLCKVVILARHRGEERAYDMGYRPIVPEPDNDARIRRLLEGR